MHRNFSLAEKTEVIVDCYQFLVCPTATCRSSGARPFVGFGFEEMATTSSHSLTIIILGTWYPGRLPVWTKS